MFGWFKKKRSATATGPDFSAVDSQAKAEELFRRGGLEKLFSISEVQSPLVNVFESCRKDFTDQNLPVIKAYMEDYKDAMAYALSHPDETRQVVADVTKIPYDTLKTFLLTKDDFYRPPTGRPNFAAIQKT